MDGFPPPAHEQLVGEADALALAGISPLNATGSDPTPLVTSSSPVAWSLAVIPSPTQAPEISISFTTLGDGIPLAIDGRRERQLRHHRADS